MGPRFYFWAVGIGTVAAWGAFGALVAVTVPVPGDILLTGGFFGTFFLALAGTSAWIIGRWRCRGGRCAAQPERLAAAARHGVLLALWGTGLLALQWHGWLTWWTAALLAGVPVLVEGAVLTRRLTRRFAEGV